jgi:hypothetical protein
MQLCAELILISFVCTLLISIAHVVEHGVCGGEKGPQGDKALLPRHIGSP